MSFVRRNSLETSGLGQSLDLSVTKIDYLSDVYNVIHQGSGPQLL